MQHALEYGDSILYRFSLYAVRTDGGRPGAKVLCADQPQKLQKIRLTVKSLPILERDVLTAYYCAPLKEDGNPYEIKELSALLGINLTTFKRALSRGRRLFSEKHKK